MIHAIIDENVALDMLTERVKYWNEDPEVINLFSNYYEECIDAGFFENSEFDVHEIVDNDYINYTDYGTLDDIKEMYGNNFDEGNILARYNDLVLYYAC